MDDKILVVTPTYNEAENITNFCNSILDLNLDLLIVDDSSPDKTYEIVQELQKINEKLFLILRSEKKGLGSAYKEGFEWALKQNYDFIVEMDADFSHSIKDLERMLLRKNSADLILGSRYIDEGGSEGWDFKRKTLSYTANLVTRIIIGTNIRDLTTGFRIYKSEKLQLTDFKDIKSDGYSFQIEMANLFFKKTFTILEVPIIFYERRLGKSKMDSTIIIEAFSTLLLLFLDRFKNEN